MTPVPLLCFRENNTEVQKDSATYPGPTVNNGKARSKTLVSWKAFHQTVLMVVVLVVVTAPLC